MKAKIKKLLIKIISHLLPIRINKQIQQFLQQSLGIGYYLTFEPIKKLMKKDVNVIFDIGASYGNYTEKLLKYYPKAQYFLFEPAKAPYQHLLSKFKNYPNIKIFNFAVSDKESFSSLYSDSKGSGLGSLHKRELDHFNIKFEESEEIETISLNTLFKNSFSNQNFKINFCKLVVEGHELTVLNSIKNNFNKFEVIQFEFGGCNIDTRIFFRDFWLLFNKNFDIYLISPSGPILLKEYSELDEVFTMTHYLAVNKN